MRSFAGRENQTESTFLQGNNLVQIPLSCIPPDRSVYRKACREISASGKFEEGYSKGHDVLALQSIPTILLIFEAI